MRRVLGSGTGQLQASRSGVGLVGAAGCRILVEGEGVVTCISLGSLAGLASAQFFSATCKETFAAPIAQCNLGVERPHVYGVNGVRSKPRSVGAQGMTAVGFDRA